MPGKSCGPCRASRRKDNPRQPAGRPRPLPPFGTGRNRLLQAGTRKQTGGRQTFPRGQTAPKGKADGSPSPCDGGKLHPAAGQCLSRCGASAQIGIGTGKITVDAVPFPEALFGLRVADKIKGVPQGKHIARIGVDVHGAGMVAHGQHTAFGLVADAAFHQALALQLSPDGIAENEQTFVQHHHLVRGQQIDDAVAHQGGQGKHLVRTGTVQAVDVSVQRGTAEDLGIRPQTAAVDGQIDVGVIVMGGDDDGARLADAGLFQNGKIRGVPVHMGGWRRN